MGRYYAHEEFDSSDYDELLDDLEHQPNVRTVLALEATLSAAFAATQAAVQVQTGRLRASGRVDSSVENGHWQGTITYGGPGTGVEYAWFEERRGGIHDYMAAAAGAGAQLDERLAQAVLRTLED
jgi:hypothetical protein